jgi:hypothetical protein
LADFAGPAAGAFAGGLSGNFSAAVAAGNVHPPSYQPPAATSGEAAVPQDQSERSLDEICELIGGVNLEAIVGGFKDRTLSAIKRSLRDRLGRALNRIDQILLEYALELRYRMLLHEPGSAFANALTPQGFMLLLSPDPSNPGKWVFFSRRHHGLCHAAGPAPACS